jgi:16S rRNA (guanine966-N2)-methyltransferase
LGGRSIVAPKNEGTRPTADATRETLFNILQNGLGLEFCYTLDLFAGSGAVAFETLSRGAQRSWLFESDRAALTAITKNAEALSLSAQIQVLRESAVEKWPAALKKSLAAGQLIDFVFADPPYGKGLAKRSFEVFARRGAELLSESCHWAIEVARDEAVPPAPEGWSLLRERSSGAAKIVVYRRGLS